ncbi:hypothetical protein NRA00_07590 [Acinetobacter baumannii]|nr:hypothetical protein [Acinetobacter baumannii]
MVFTDNDLKKLNIFNDIASLINEISLKIQDENYRWESVYSKTEVFVSPKNFFFNLHEFIHDLDNLIYGDEGMIEDFFFPLDALKEKLILLSDFKNKNSIFEYLIYIFNDFFEKFILNNGSEGFKKFIQKLQGKPSFYHFLRDILPYRGSEFNTGFFDINSSNANSFYLSKIRRLEDDIIKLKKDVGVNDGKIKEQIIAHLQLNDIYLKDKTNTLVSNFNLMINEYKIQYESNEKKNIEELSKPVQESQRELSNLFGDIENYKSLISDKTQSEISKFYFEKSIWERNTYLAMTTLSLLIIIFAIGLAWFGLSGYYSSYVNPQGFAETTKNLNIEKINLVQSNALNYLILRLVISILLFLSLIYTSRIAYRSYIHWRHSENMHLKLASLRPFINHLNEEERSKIHKDLIPDYFGKDAGVIDNSTSEKFNDLPANISAIAIKAIEQISLGGNNLNKSENSSKKDST